MNNEQPQIETNNIFDDAFNRFRQDADYERLHEKYRLKSYKESRKGLNRFAIASSYVLNLVSIATASTCVVWLLNLPIQAGLPVALVLLACLEGLKRYSIPLFFKERLQFQKLNIGMMLTIIMLAGASAPLSYFGMGITIEHLTDAPELLNIQNIQTEYADRAKIFNENIERAEKMLWQKRITRKGQAIIKDAQSSLAALEVAKTKAIQEAQSANVATISGHKDKTANKAYYGALIALFCDVSLIFCFWFMEYYDYRSISEFSAPKTTRFIPSEPVPPTNIPAPMVQPVSAIDTRPRNIPDVVGSEYSEYSSDFKVIGDTIKVIGVKAPLTKAGLRAKISTYKWKLKVGEGKEGTNKNNIKKFEKALNILKNQI